jgi:hypothetical protein
MAEILKPVPQEDLKLTDKSEGSVSSAAAAIGVVEYNPALDRKLLWRRDLVLIPIMGVLYMLLFLDRTNIANVRLFFSVTGLTVQLEYAELAPCDFRCTRKKHHAYTDL